MSAGLVEGLLVRNIVFSGLLWGSFSLQHLPFIVNSYLGTLTPFEKEEAASLGEPLLRREGLTPGVVASTDSSCSGD